MSTSETIQALEGEETLWFESMVATFAKPTSVIIQLTPALAKVLLGANTHNRDLQPTRVSQMVDDMLAGRWQTNGDSIRVSTMGIILDGAHRLHAVVISGITIDTFIIFGLPAETQESMDDTYVRKLKHAFQLAGIGDSKNRATLTALVMQYERYGRLFTAGSYQPSLRAKTIRAGEISPELDEALEAVPRLERSNVPIPKLATFYIILKRLGANKDDIVTFMHQLVSGEMLGSGSPVLAARNWLLKAKAAKGRTVTVTEYFELLARTWNCNVLGEERTAMKLVGGGMPELIIKRPETA